MEHLESFKRHYQSPLYKSTALSPKNVNFFFVRFLYCEDWHALSKVVRYAMAVDKGALRFDGVKGMMNSLAAFIDDCDYQWMSSERMNNFVRFLSRSLCDEDWEYLRGICIRASDVSFLLSRGDPKFIREEDHNYIDEVVEYVGYLHPIAIAMCEHL